MMCIFLEKMKKDEDYFSKYCMTFGSITCWLVGSVLFMNELQK